MQAHHWSRRGSRTRERTNARLALASNGVRCPSASTPTVCRLITKVRRLSCNVQLPVLSELTYSACTTTSSECIFARHPCPPPHRCRVPFHLTGCDLLRRHDMKSMTLRCEVMPIEPSLEHDFARELLCPTKVFPPNSTQPVGITAAAVGLRPRILENPARWRRRALNMGYIADAQRSKSRRASRCCVLSVECGTTDRCMWCVQPHLLRVCGISHSCSSLTCWK